VRDVQYSLGIGSARVIGFDYGFSMRRFYGRLPVAAAHPFDERVRAWAAGFVEELPFGHAASCRSGAAVPVGRIREGSPFGRPPDAFELSCVAEGRIGTADPDSRVVRVHGRPAVQGQQAARGGRPGVRSSSPPRPPSTHCELQATLRDVDMAGVGELLTTVAAGCWQKGQIAAVLADGIRVLIPPIVGYAKANASGGTAGSTPSCSPGSPASNSTLPGTRKRVEPSSGRSKTHSALYPPPTKWQEPPPP
jgi:hypothetical protein